VSTVRLTARRVKRVLKLFEATTIVCSTSLRSHASGSGGYLQATYINDSETGDVACERVSCGSSSSRSNGQGLISTVSLVGKPRRPGKRSDSCAFLASVGTSPRGSNKPEQSMQWSSDLSFLGRSFRMSGLHHI
jgi:hypothetical protein